MCACKNVSTYMCMRSCALSSKSKNRTKMSKLKKYTLSTIDRHLITIGMRKRLKNRIECVSAWHCYVKLLKQQISFGKELKRTKKNWLGKRDTYFAIHPQVAICQKSSDQPLFSLSKTKKSWHAFFHLLYVINI